LKKRSEREKDNGRLTQKENFKGEEMVKEEKEMKE